MVDGVPDVQPRSPPRGHAQAGAMRSVRRLYCGVSYMPFQWCWCFSASVTFVIWILKNSFKAVYESIQK